MGIFGSKVPKAPQIRVVREGAGNRVLDFSEFMDKEMKQRVKSGNLEWTDKVDIFETFYIPTRFSEGWVLIPRGDDRFKAEWQVGDQVIVGKYNDGESTVTERVKKKK